MASMTQSATTRLLGSVQESNREQEYDATINLAEVSIHDALYKHSGYIDTGLGMPRVLYFRRTRLVVP